MFKKHICEPFLLFLRSEKSFGFYFIDKFQIRNMDRGKEEKYVTRFLGSGVRRRMAQVVSYSVCRPEFKKLTGLFSWLINLFFSHGVSSDVNYTK